MMLDADAIRTIAERATVFKDRNLHVTVIANPVAGGFTIKKKAVANRVFFGDALSAMRDRPIVAKSCTVAIRYTEKKDHAREMAREIIAESLADPDPSSLFFIVTAGGDGTSLDVQTELAHAYFTGGNKKLTEKICLLRLPFGTGNDGSDGRSLDQSLSLLTGKSIFARQCAVRVYPAGQERSPWYAFNIASIGIDAFVTHMTNQVKNLFPGDFYKIWVDLACLFYNWIYHVGEMRVSAWLKDGSFVREHRDRCVLYLMGASGHRTYGSNQKILPGEDNVCGVREMPLLRKLKLKKRFLVGAHASFPETLLYTADRLVFDYDEKILVQLDGEGHLLKPSDFPLTMERTEAFITILKSE
jgi:diacylglycerol kinase family enzyme